MGFEYPVTLWCWGSSAAWANDFASIPARYIELVFYGINTLGGKP